MIMSSNQLRLALEVHFEASALGCLFEVLELVVGYRGSGKASITISTLGMPCLYNSFQPDCRLEADSLVEFCWEGAMRYWMDAMMELMEGEARNSQILNIAIRTNPFVSRRL